MEGTETKRVKGQQEPRGVLEAELLRPQMAFLAENPEAFGLVSDACPLATKHILIAANGGSPSGGVNAPVYELEHPGVDGLYALYGDILPRNDEITEALQVAFGENANLREYPITRYCSILAETIALWTLRDGTNSTSLEETCILLNERIRSGLAALEASFSSREDDFPLHADFFSVSMGICRLQEITDGEYVADFFSAGDFSLYILDHTGMAPLWDTVTPVFTSVREDGLRGRRIRFYHSEPFALLLVSESICALNATEARSLRSNPGLVWKYRMRLEDHFQRLLTDCVREHEFGDRATRFFMGKTHGRDSASGAITILRNGVTYETFREICQTRLLALERAMELLPDGYDEREIPTVGCSRADVEIAYIRRLLEENADLTDRVANALRVCVLRKFREGKPTTILPAPADVPEYDRLEWEEIQEIFALFDSENDEDRACVAANTRILRESLSEHWVTLRPVLLSQDEGGNRNIRLHRALSERLYQSCLEMNGQLAAMLAIRKKTISRLGELLATSLDILDVEGNDWICGRTTGERVGVVADRLMEELPSVLAYLHTDWRSDTEAYQRLLTAYTDLREDLFRRDVQPVLGGFAKDWQGIMEGKLDESRWGELKDRLVGNSETAAYADLFDALYRISHGTGALYSRIRSRAAENRMARHLSDQPELHISALRGAAYEDPDWGSEVIAVMDTATRNDFRATVRRWKESCELVERQKHAYLEYSSMYGSYIQ